MPAHNIRFLVIDRDVQVQEAVRSAVAVFGYGQTLGVENVREGLRAIESGAIEFVICDWPSDVEPALGLAKLLKGQESLRYIPILMTVPAAAASDGLKRVAAVGVEGVLAKPYDAVQLKSALDQILARTPSL